MDATQITLTTAAIGSVLAFLGSVANMLNTNYKERIAIRERDTREERARKWALDLEERNRRWSKEDKLELARHTSEDLRRTQSTISHHFDELKLKGDERLKTIVAGQEELRDQVAKNTEISKEAFKEANGVNAKLLALGHAPINPTEVVVVNDAPILVKETK